MTTKVADTLNELQAQSNRKAEFQTVIKNHTVKVYFGTFNRIEIRSIDGFLSLDKLVGKELEKFIEDNKERIEELVR